MRNLRIAVCQSDYRVGDIKNNAAKILEGIDRAAGTSADVVLFPELAVPGYPPEDLLFKPDFIDANIQSLNAVSAHTRGKNLLAVVGFIDRKDDIYNGAAILFDGKIVDVYHKIYLPNYGVFDEKRYFRPGGSIPIYNFRGVRIGVNICEDIWYPLGPGHFQASGGDAEVILNVSASPYFRGKQDYRESMYSARSGDEAVYLVNANLTGGQDELVFDGASTAYDPRGNLILRMKSFEEDFAALDIDADAVFRERLKDIRRRELKGREDCPFALRQVDIASEKQDSPKETVHPVPADNPSGIESIYKALVLGTRDYVNKNGFKNVVIAVSGGIDSALVAAIAVEALGKERVSGVYMPSRFSADISGEDAGKLAKNLGIELHEIPIEPLFEQFLESLAPAFRDLPFGVAEENIQSRIRGNLIMALSNKFGWLVLTTGNKSEMSTGYATLYGDMAGGFAVIKDVVKTTVYELSEYINREKEIIPRRIIDRPPSAELRPDQKDTDSLPEYAVLDKIIRGYVEDDKSFEEIASETGDAALVARVIRMIDLNEYKRRQAPPGVKVTPRAFGRDRRMPITNGFNLDKEK